MTQLTPIRGFTNTPVTKSVIVIGTLLALGLSTLQIKHYVKLAIDPLIVQYSQYWRIATFQLSVINESDFLLSTILWFHFKTLERFFGPRKYLSLIAVFAFYNAVLTFLVLSVGQLSLNAVLSLITMLRTHTPYRFIYRDTFFNSVASGPFGILASLYMCYGSYIPVSYQFKILFRKANVPSENSEASNNEADDASSNEGFAPKSLTLNDHFQIHILFTLLMFNNGIGSLLPCLIGVIVGRLYTNDLLAGSKNCYLPNVVFRLFINPRKLNVSAFQSVRQRIRGFQPLPQAPQPEAEPTPEREEEQDETIDDIRNTEEPPNRSETPVRPLGRQFLETFRT
ncbi:hypothetical protein FT663_01479 [Candidozyma haemuli var. vulneris]|uniref:Peptidase S54 rhomboid domain-containing protein n=1 Tax=Candidozyma haemuli TaxID=45357 RepID=A0A2V1ASE2_9ASCO|nr:hypothetical protein CXQ85_000102 [[Candida] haemuloni]KAF3990107.1 hypothetical protein FT662_02431 [[Candida] haemuloni var. vulneris]KAF3994359.1 hypothetical protein FT663_01479 [[Candida] haemuloni var. vulneris]PVH21137.1 hypothetical protein CXQ85_000102 [[Candida] haemuloni]